MPLPLLTFQPGNETCRPVGFADKDDQGGRIGWDALQKSGKDEAARAEGRLNPRRPYPPKKFDLRSERKNLVPNVRTSEFIRGRTAANQFVPCVAADKSRA